MSEQNQEQVKPVDPVEAIEAENAEIHEEATPEVKPAPKPEEKPKHDLNLVGLALDLGMTEAEVAASTPGELSFAVRQLNRQAQRLAQPRPAPTPEPEETDELDLGVDEDGKPIVPEKVFDPALAKFMRAQAKRTKELEKELKATRSGSADVQRDNMTRAIDSAFDGLGESYHEVIGKGGINVLPQNSNFRGRRNAIVTTAIQMAQQSGKPVHDCIAAATNLLYGERKKSQPKEEELEQRKKDWEEAPTAKPTHRAEGKRKGPAPAAKAVADLIKQYSSSDDGNGEADVAGDFPK